MLALLAAGCGGEREPEPRLQAGLAQSLAERSDSVAALLEEQDPCGARSEAQQLQADAIAAVNAGRVPAGLQEELLAGATSLAESIDCPSAAGSSDQLEEARSLSSWLRERS